eukprot:9170360-Karenia_brevis.AAC.1
MSQFDNEKPKYFYKLLTKGPKYFYKLLSIEAWLFFTGAAPLSSNVIEWIAISCTAGGRPT